MNQEIALLLSIVLMPSATNATVGAELWGGLKIGMTKNEVARRLPTGRAVIVPGCPMRVTANWSKNEKLASLTFRPISPDKSEDCRRAIGDAYDVKYGPSFAPMIPEGPQTVGEQFNEWDLGPIQITIVFSYDNPKWFIKFESLQVDNGR